MMTNHNFEGFSGSLPLDDVSDSDSVITAGQRNSAEIENLMNPQNSVILIEPVSLLDGGPVETLNLVKMI